MEQLEIVDSTYRWIASHAMSVLRSSVHFRADCHELCVSFDTRATVGAMEGGFLAELTPAAREVLEHLGRRKRFDTGATLFVEGDVSATVFVVHAGHVKVFSTTTDGHEVLLAIRGPGDVLGDLSAIDGEPRNAGGSALEPVDAQVISATEFRAFLAETKSAGLALVHVIIARMRDSDRLRVEFGARDTLGRVAMRLLELAETAGESSDGVIRITVPLTQEDLAAWVAASREGVARALASLRHRDLIRTSRREITVLDLEGLREATR
jgi:CRP-like cAMP-binding protein